MDLEAALVDHESVIRLSFFGGVLFLLLIAERVWPDRARVLPGYFRPALNLVIGALGSLAGRLLAPVAGVAAALYAAKEGIGLVAIRDLPDWAAALAGIAALDLVIYFQHRIFHKVPVLWRLHAAHHSDPDIDVTTALRFHPVEVGLSALVKAATVLALGIPAIAVIAFEIFLNACAMFNHSNLRLARPLDAFLSLFLVTPRLHRIHHSVIVAEQNSIFGFSINLWDRIFGTFRSAPAGTLITGMREVQAARTVEPIHVLITGPFSRKGWW